jgi:hypothetical protein
VLEGRIVVALLPVLEGRIVVAPLPMLERRIVVAPLPVLEGRIVVALLPVLEGRIVVAPLPVLEGRIVVVIWWGWWPGLWLHFSMGLSVWSCVLVQVQQRASVHPGELRCGDPAEPVPEHHGCHLSPHTHHHRHGAVVWAARGEPCCCCDVMQPNLVCVTHMCKCGEQCSFYWGVLDESTHACKSPFLMMAGHLL